MNTSGIDSSSNQDSENPVMNGMAMSWKNITNSKHQTMYKAWLGSRERERERILPYIYSSCPLLQKE
jgi:hypothetical protein